MAVHFRIAQIHIFSSLEKKIGIVCFVEDLIYEVIGEGTLGIKCMMPWFTNLVGYNVLDMLNDIISMQIRLHKSPDFQQEVEL